MFTATIPFPSLQAPGSDDILAVNRIIDQIKRRRPMAFILEGNTDLNSFQFGDYSGNMMTDLQRASGYTVYSRVLNSADHGVPHDRERVYICGVREDCNKERLTWPAPIEAWSLDDLLDDEEKRETAVNELPSDTDLLVPGTAPGDDRVPMIIVETTVPLDSGPSDEVDYERNVTNDSEEKVDPIRVRRGTSEDLQYRAWIAKKSRWMTITEMCRLQGMDPRQMVEPEENVRTNRLLAEAASLNVLERVILEVLRATGVVDDGAKDRWEEGSAQTSLRTSWGAVFASKANASQPTVLECDGERESIESYIDPDEEAVIAAEGTDDHVEDGSSLIDDLFGALAAGKVPYSFNSVEFIMQNEVKEMIEESPKTELPKQSNGDSHSTSESANVATDDNTDGPKEEHRSAISVVKDYETQ